jgi:hypothetical protein
VTDDRPLHEWLQEYSPLLDAVGPLVTLAEVNPTMLPAIIELAMALGIRASDLHAARRTHTPETYGQLAAIMAQGWRGFR